jgi:hypothetical protein
MTENLGTGKTAGAFCFGIVPSLSTPLNLRRVFGMICSVE